MRMLEDKTFSFFPGIVSQDHAKCRHAILQKLQKRNIDPVYIKAAVQGFTNNMQINQVNTLIYYWLIKLLLIKRFLVCNILIMPCHQSE